MFYDFLPACSTTLRFLSRTHTIITLVFHLPLNTHFPQEPQFLAFSNQCKYLERWLVTAVKCPPGASETPVIAFETKRHTSTMKVAPELSESLLMWDSPRWWKWEALRTLNSWQDPLKARALVYQFAFNITKMRWRALRRSGLFYLASKLRAHHKPLLFSLFHVEVKVGVNICRASPPREEKTRLVSVCLVWKTSLKACVHTE